MADRIVSFAAGELDKVLSELEGEFARQGVPNLLRLRAAVLTEELFDALQALDDSTGQLRCTFPAPRTMRLQYRNPKGALKPELRMVQRLSRDRCTDGVNAAFAAGQCIITAQEKIR